VLVPLLLWLIYDATSLVNQQKVDVLLDAFQALNITNIIDFLIMEQIDFESVILVNTQPHNLSKLEIRKLLKAQEWYKTLPDSNKNVATWLDLTMDAFNTFMMNGHTIVTATIPINAESLLLPGNNTNALSTSRARKNIIVKYCVVRILIVQYIFRAYDILLLQYIDETTLRRHDELQNI
jgi:hypothetical protein